MSVACDVAVLASLIAIIFIVLESFETLVLPRRIERPLRGVAVFYGTLWRIWRLAARLVPPKGRDNFLAIFGPLSLLLLLTLWAVGLIFSFAGLQWGLQSPLHAPEATPTFTTYVYLSATTFITLGFGDVVAITRIGRFITDIEAGTGFGFLAIVIGYFPVLYGAFSRREVDIALLDARASSPPSAGAMLQRVAGYADYGDLYELLREYERWSAELIESHLSYPVLMWYRSQHDRQSWLSALTTILDTCAFIVAMLPDSKLGLQARMTFAMSRHAAVDLALVFEIPPAPPKEDRLSSERLREFCALLTESGMNLTIEAEQEARLHELRALYDPYVNTLGLVLELNLPSWMPNPDLPDNWQTSSWDRDDHFFQSAERQREHRRKIGRL